MTIFQSTRTFFARRKNTLSEPQTGTAEDAQSLKARGNELLAAGKLAEATDCYRRAAELTPQDAVLHVNLGYGALELGDLASARHSLQRAIELDSLSPDAHFLLGQALARMGESDAAVERLRSALALKPHFDFAWFELAGLQQRMGEREAALDSYSRVLMITPAFLDAASARAGLLLTLGRWKEVLDITAKYMHSSGDAVFAVLEALALNGLGRLDEALLVINAALARQPDDIRAWDAKAAILTGQQQHAQALDIHLHLLRQQPESVPVLYNAAATCIKLGSFTQALEFYAQAARIAPQDAGAHCNMAYALLQLGRVREALQACDRGLALDPEHADLHWNKGFTHLLLGELRKGWPEHEWRWLARSNGSALVQPDFVQPIWRGEPLEGKTIFLYAEQGFGDTFLMLRYVPLLRSRGAKILLKIQAPIRPLCTEAGWDCTLVDTPDAHHFDYHCPLLSLPLAFGTDLGNLPAAPYLRSNDALRQQWEEVLGPRRGPRIGLVWSGNASQLNDANRSLPLAELLAILPAGCQFVSLQKEVRESDMPAMERGGLFHDGAKLRTFAETAALADLMDLVISVDTGVSHLVGALGKPIWIMLPFLADWRWMIEREDSPWFPSARLFRKGADRSWQPVLDRISAELTVTFPVAAKTP